MKSPSSMLATILLATALVGCEKHTHDEGSPATPGTHTHADGSTHASHANPDSSHSHGHGHSHSHGGEIVALGEGQILGFTVKAKREGEVAAGKEAVFLIESTPATDAVRVWVGDEQATNSVRARGEGGPTSFHAHAMVPSPLAEGAQLWVEVQNSNGERAAVAFSLSATSSDEHSHGDAAHSHSHDAEHSHSHDGQSHSHDHGDHGHSH